MWTNSAGGNPAYGRRVTSNRQIVAVSLVLGAVAAIGTFHGGAMAADVALLAICGMVRRRPAPWVWFLAVPIALTAFWAIPWWLPLWTAARIVGLGIVFAGWRPRLSMVTAGFLTVLAVQTLGLVMVLDYPRPNGFTANASVLGQVGLTAFIMGGPGAIGIASGAIGAFTMGVAVSRTALLAAVVYVVVRPRRWTVALLLCGAAVVVVHSALAGNFDRFGLEGIRSQLVGRNELLSGDNSARAGFLTERVNRDKLTYAETEERYPFNPPRFTLLGYGYDSYIAAVNAIHPHTIPVLIVYELGILSLPIFGVVAWAFWKRKLPLTFGLVMLPLWLLTEETWAVPAGHYLMALMLLAALRQKKQKAAADYVRAQWVRARTWAATVHTKRHRTTGDQGNAHQRPAE